MFFVMASPKPIPVDLVVKFGMKILLCIFSGIPGPLSDMLISIHSKLAGSCRLSIVS